MSREITSEFTTSENIYTIINRRILLPLWFLGVKMINGLSWPTNLSKLLQKRRLVPRLKKIFNNIMDTIARINKVLKTHFHLSMMSVTGDEQECEITTDRQIVPTYPTVVRQRKRPTLWRHALRTHRGDLLHQPLLKLGRHFAIPRDKPKSKNRPVIVINSARAKSNGELDIANG